MPRAHRALPALCAAMLCVAGVAPASGAPASTDVGVVVDGVGAAHGMGLAMDGVLGQTRNKWTYARTLDLFYKGTTKGSARGPVRVGLASAQAHRVELPTGGEVSDAPAGSKAGPGFPIRLPAGAAVEVSYAAGRYAVKTPGVLHAAQATIAPLPTLEPVPSEAPVLPTPSPGPSPTPGGEATPAPDTREPEGPSSSRPIWVTPAGDPGLARLAATGRRYRGRMELRWSEASAALWSVNHVDLETYVRGIAEEKGAGWPVEGLKVLAVAARSLAVATTTWYGKHHANGFDICPSANCQVYLGYDGEEGAMTQAANATAGEIRTFNGRAILAMYHGNGGGRTESYRLAYAGGTSDPHPYLTSVQYPFANPSRWRKEFASSQVEAALRAGGIAVSGRLTGVEVLERGMSPRVLKLRVVGTGGTVDTTGLKFQSALALRSAWFDVSVGGPPPANPDAIVPEDPALPLVEPPSEPVTAAATVVTRRPPPVVPKVWRPDVLALATLVLSAAALGVLGQKREHGLVVGGVVHDVEVRPRDGDRRRGRHRVRERLRRRRERVALGGDDEDG